MKIIVAIVCSFLLGSAPFVYHLYKSHTVQASAAPVVATENNKPVEAKDSPVKVNVPPTNAVDDKQNSMQKLTTSVQTWIVDKNNFRADFNSYSPEIAVLESGDLFKMIDNLPKLQSDYNSLQANYNILVKDSSNIMDVLEKDTQLKQDTNVKNLLLAIGQSVDDVGTINKIIKTDIDSGIDFANKLNSGKLKENDKFYTHYDQFNSTINDFKTQNLKIEQFLDKIK